MSKSFEDELKDVILNSIEVEVDGGAGMRKAEFSLKRTALAQVMQLIRKHRPEKIKITTTFDDHIYESWDSMYEHGQAVGFNKALDDYYRNLGL